MGGQNSGRYRRGSRTVTPHKREGLKQLSQVLDARELVRNGVIRGDKRQSGSLQSILIHGQSWTVSGRYLADCHDTLPLRQQNDVKHRMRLGSLRLEYTRDKGPLVFQEIDLLAGLTSIGMIYWGFSCPQCRRYARKLFMPCGRPDFRCRRCYNLRYLSQEKLNAYARRCDEEWSIAHRHLGIPSPKMTRMLQRAGIFTSTTTYSPPYNFYYGGW